METEDRALLEQWMAKWSDLVEFEVYPVITSKEAVEKKAIPTPCNILTTKRGQKGLQRDRLSRK
jgi:hypothetical protein